MTRRRAQVLAGALLAAATTRAPPAAAAPLAAPSAGTWTVRVGVSGQRGLIPPFFDRPRDRWTAELAARWRPDPRVALDATVDALRWDLHGDGGRALGGGDIRLGTELRLWPGPLQGRLRWEVKLPDAEDDRGLGTDETDVALIAALRGVAGPAAMGVAGGVDLRGDPGALRHRVAVPRLDLTARTSLGVAEGWLSLRGELPAADEPGRALIDIGTQLGCPLSGGLAALWGPPPAGPELGARVFIGWRDGCAGGGSSSPAPPP